MIQYGYIYGPLSVIPHMAARCVPLLVVALALFALSPTAALADPLRLQPGLVSTLAKSPDMAPPLQVGQDAVRLGAESQPLFGRPAGGQSEREISTDSTRRAAIWPITGVLFFLAVALAGLNARRGRRTPRTTRAF